MRMWGARNGQDDSRNVAPSICLVLASNGSAGSVHTKGFSIEAKNPGAS